MSIADNLTERPEKKCLFFFPSPACCNSICVKIPCVRNLPILTEKHEKKYKCCFYPLVNSVPSFFSQAFYVLLLLNPSRPLLFPFFQSASFFFFIPGSRLKFCHLGQEKKIWENQCLVKAPPIESNNPSSRVQEGFESKLFSRNSHSSLPGKFPYSPIHLEICVRFLLFPFLVQFLRTLVE